MDRPLPTPDEAVDAEHPWLWLADPAPARLAGMARPVRGFPFPFLAGLGFTDLVCLRDEVGYDPAPLAVHHVPLEDLVGGRMPRDPAAEQQAVRRAVETVEELLADGRRVVVHCGAGVGRTGTVIGAVLVAQGHPAGEVAHWLDAVQRRRGRAGWPESDWQRSQLTP